jgi:hypothetical protein
MLAVSILISMSQGANSCSVSGFSHMHDSGTGGVSSSLNSPWYVLTRTKSNQLIFPVVSRTRDKAKATSPYFPRRAVLATTYTNANFQRPCEQSNESTIQ